MKIILDERESALWTKMTNTDIKLVLSKCVLPLGDISIRTDNDEEIILLERKSLQDLLSSIKDGRYAEQSHRLQHSTGIHSHNIVYIIEGIMSQCSNKERKMIYSAMTTLSIFKGFSVIRTSGVQETADWISAMADKINRELEKGKTMRFLRPSSDSNPDTNKQPEELDTNLQQVIPEYCSVVKKVKKDNLTPENMGQMILCQIPSISSVSAIAIMEKYKSISQLMRELVNDPNCLNDVRANSRKLSKTVIQNIKTFLLYEKVVGNNVTSIIQEKI